MRMEILDAQQLVFAIPEFLLPSECSRYIERSEQLGYTPAPLSTAQGPVLQPDVRSNYRVMFDDYGLARALWTRLQRFIPGRALDWEDRECQALGLNERIRMFRYDPKQRFAPHFDGAFRRHAGEFSLLSFIVYLNDNFQGGETRFFHERGSLRFSVKPQTGTALVFLHNQYHEGAFVVRGRKYVLRSDVMYARRLSA